MTIWGTGFVEMSQNDSLHKWVLFEHLKHVAFTLQSEKGVIVSLKKTEKYRIHYFALSGGVRVSE
jgi:hypothetical protein